MHVRANGVEVRDWTRVMGRRLSLLLVIPITAAVLASFLAFLQPQTYKTTATVILPTRDTGGPLSSAVSQFTSDFEGAITSDGVAQSTSVATGEPKSAINRGISTKREGTSSVVEVTYTGTDTERAAAVVEAAARDALAQIAQVQLDVIQAQFDAAQRIYDEAVAEQQQVAQETGIVDVSVVKNIFQHRLLEATDALNAAKATGTAGEIAQAQDRFDQLSKRNTELVSRYEVADDRVTTTRGALAFLQGEVLKSQGIVDQAKNSTQIQASPARATSRFTFVLRRTMFAGAFGLLLAVGLVILLEFLRPSPLNRIRHEATLPGEPVRRSPGQFVS